MELLVMATPMGADILGIIKHRTKALLDSVLSVPTTLTPSC
jgi:hypothetical protein